MFCVGGGRKEDGLQGREKIRAGWRGNLVGRRRAVG